MKRKVIALFVIVCMVIGLVSCAAPETNAPSVSNLPVTTEQPSEEQPIESKDNKNYKIGMAFYGLSNPIWAEEVESAVAYGKQIGVEVTYVDAGTDSGKQIAQIENFIQSGVDAIVVLAIDTTALEDVTNKAKEQGIRIIDFTREMQTADTSITLDCEANGRALAEMAADWAKKNFEPGEKIEWAFLNIPTVQLGVEEGEATERAMKELLPDAELVATGATLTIEEGINNTENFLQAHPNLRLILSLGAGGGVGGNEAIKSSVNPEDYDKYGLFSIDATEQELQNIINGDPQKGSISLGAAKEIGIMMIDVAIETLENENFNDQYYLPITKIDSPEAAQRYFDANYK